MSVPARSTLVTGGARSGKSRYAERLALSFGLRPIYIATAEALDDEMAERIRLHRERRGALWTTREAPLDLPRALQETSAVDSVVLVDCLTLWITNLLVAEKNVAGATAELLASLARCQGPAVLVSNEVGWGIVPTNALARRFRDEAGALNQAVAARAERVVLVAAGLPLVLKGTPEQG